MKTTITIVATPEHGTNVNVENAVSKEHAIYLLTQAIQTLVVPEEEKHEDVSELSTTTESEEESTVSEV